MKRSWRVDVQTFCLLVMSTSMMLSSFTSGLLSVVLSGVSVAFAGMTIGVFLGRAEARGNRR